MKFKLIPPTGHKLKLSYLFKQPSQLPAGFLLNSGTAALTFLLQNLRRKNSGKIIIPAYSCPNLATAVLQAGFSPVLCDINLNRLDYDSQELQKLIEAEQPDAVILVNLFGMLESVPNLPVPVILDNAQGVLEKKISGNYAAQIVSFGRGKRINSLSGGIAQIIASKYFGDLHDAYARLADAAFAAETKYLANFLFYSVFYHPHLYWLPAGIPMLKIGETIFEPRMPLFKMAKFNLNVANAVFSNMKQIDAMRERVVGQYLDVIGGHAAIEHIYSGEKSFRLPILLKSAAAKPEFLKMMAGEGIGASAFYPSVLNAQDGLDKILVDKIAYPNSDILVGQLVTLPVNEFVTGKIISRVKNCLDRLPI